MLNARRSDDVEEYAAAALPFLEAAPCERNVLRSLVERARSRSALWAAPPMWFWVEEGSTTVAAASWTPPQRLLVSTLSADAASALAAAVHEAARGRGLRLSGVNGPPSGARAFAGAWSALTGESSVVRMHLYLHELTAVIDPPQPSGRARPAAAHDTDVLVDWLVRFSVETGAPAPPDPRQAIERALELGTMHVWDDGTVVSMTGSVRPVAGVARVGPVFTPPVFRNRGYARALVAVVSRGLLGMGAERCVLYTDQANPVSNAIYRQVGYVLIDEAVELRFIQGGGQHTAAGVEMATPELTVRYTCRASAPDAVSRP